MDDAARHLAHLGFLLISPYPDRAGEALLLVALRDRPTLQHFDPELIRYWRTGADQRGHHAELSRETPLPCRALFSWGKITLIDRLGIENRFATLGGDLKADAVAPDLSVAAFTSPGPILRLGGHSQDTDAVALELGAFFARMMVPIDFEPGVEAAISAASPLERYAAFIAFEQARYRTSRTLREEPSGIGRVLAEESERLSRAEPDAWQAGHALLGEMSLGS